MASAVRREALGLAESTTAAAHERVDERAGAAVELADEAVHPAVGTGDEQVAVRAEDEVDGLVQVREGQLPEAGAGRIFFQVWLAEHAVGLG